MPSRVARLRLAQAVETQFDTSVVAAFEAILAGRDGGVSYGLVTRVHIRVAAGRSRSSRTRAVHRVCFCVTSDSLSTAPRAELS